MIRKILCRTCGSPLVYPREDLEQGWQHRDVFLSLTLPVSCDGCGKPLDSEIVVARTEWQGKGHKSPRYWEEEFGTVMTSAAVVLHDKLTEQK